MNKNRTNLIRRFGYWSIQGILLLSITAGILYALDPKEVNLNFIIKFILGIGLAIGGMYTIFERIYVPSRIREAYRKATGNEDIRIFQVNNTPILYEHRLKLAVLPFPIMSEKRLYYISADHSVQGKGKILNHHGKEYKLLYSTHYSHKSAVKKLKKLLA